MYEDFEDRNIRALNLGDYWMGYQYVDLNNLYFALVARFYLKH